LAKRWHFLALQCKAALKSFFNSFSLRALTHHEKYLSIAYSLLALPFPRCLSLIARCLSLILEQLVKHERRREECSSFLILVP
jgi:hypothetical protein